MAKYFEIKQASNGLQVFGRNRNYYFSSKLFSHSSELRDQDSVLVASLRRKNWWRMHFELETSGGNYELRQGSLTTKLASEETNTQFFDLGGGEFFRKNIRVTELQNKDVKSCHFDLIIRDEEHWLALLMATCLACNGHIHLS